MRAALLQLLDSRFPAGAHAHSGGMEQAVAAGLVRHLADAERWATDVLWSTGLCSAALAVTAWNLCDAGGCDSRAWEQLHAEADARMPSAAQRSTSKRLGRQLLRSAQAVWPALEELGTRWPDGMHRAVVFGAAVHAAGAGDHDAALGEAYQTVSMPMAAALRLLGLDPLSVSAATARLGRQMEQVADQACAAAKAGPACLPRRSAPMVDVCAEIHSRRRGVLFAS